MIVADLFHPSRDGAGYLYTVEHFQAVKQRLAPGGVFCQWLPIYQLDMKVLKTIMRSFLDSFSRRLGLYGPLQPDPPHCLPGGR